MTTRRVIAVCWLLLSGCSLTLEPDSGYPTCFEREWLDGTGAVCREWVWWTPQAEALATSNYDTSIGDVVQDLVTGLTWQRAQAPGTYTLAAAQAYCEGLTLAGLGGWRVPTLAELLSIVDYSRVSPAINVTVFPSTGAAAWTATVFSADGNNAWYVSFSAGTTQTASSSNHFNLRCVR